MHLAALAQVCAEITGKPLPEEDFAAGTVDAYRTVVEMVTIRGPDRLAPQEEVLRETLARCFDVLTDVSSMDSNPVAAPEQMASALWLAGTVTSSYADGAMGVMPLAPASSPLGTVLVGRIVSGACDGARHRSPPGLPSPWRLPQRCRPGRHVRREVRYPPHFWRATDFPGRLPDDLAGHRHRAQHAAQGENPPVKEFRCPPRASAGGSARKRLAPAPKPRACLRKRVDVTSRIPADAASTP